MAKLIKANILNNRDIKVLFDDGVYGSFTFDQYFSPRNDSILLNDDAFFQQMFLSSETDALTWPNGYDICSDLVYAIVSGQKIEVDGAVVFDPKLP